MSSWVKPGRGGKWASTRSRYTPAQETLDPQSSLRDLQTDDGPLGRLDTGALDHARQGEVLQRVERQLSQWDCLADPGVRRVGGLRYTEVV